MREAWAQEGAWRCCLRQCWGPWSGPVQRKRGDGWLRDNAATEREALGPAVLLGLKSSGLCSLATRKGASSSSRPATHGHDIPLLFFPFFYYPFMTWIFQNCASDFARRLDVIVGMKGRSSTRIFCCVSGNTPDGCADNQNYDLLHNVGFCQNSTFNQQRWEV